MFDRLSLAVCESVQWYTSEVLSTIENLYFGKRKECTDPFVIDERICVALNDLEETGNAALLPLSSALNLGSRTDGVRQVAQ